MSLVTIKEAASRLAISPRGVRRLVASGALDHCRIGERAVRIPESSLDAYVERATIRGRAHFSPEALHPDLRPRTSPSPTPAAPRRP